MKYKKLLERYFIKMRLLTKYKNGNYIVRLYEDGTKIRMNNLDNLTPLFAESIDITITEKCSGTKESPLCKYCYLGCTEKGKHADLTNSIFDTIHAGTEMAINANDMTHPGLEDFLIRMKEKGVFVNITINQKHLKQNIDILTNWQNRKLIWGIGISLTDSTDSILWENNLKNTVIHVIDGCFSKEDLENLSNHNIKLLILGFKHKGRGIDYYNTYKEEVDNNIRYLDEHLMEYKNQFNGFAFDTLATNDLHVKEKVGPKKWALNNMGEEGEFTMYFSAVDNTYSISSMDSDHIYKIKEGETLDDLFRHVRKLAGFDI